MIIVTAVLLLSFIFLIRTIRTNKTKEMVRTSIRIGVNCYGCKEFIDNTPYNDVTVNTSNLEDFLKVENLRLCSICKRDNIINKIVKKSAFDLLKIKRFFYSNKLILILKYQLILYVIFFILHLVTFFILKEENNIFFYLYNTLLISQWLILNKRMDWDFIKKRV